MNKIYRGISGVSGDMFQVQIFGSVDTPGPHGVSIAFRQLTLSRHRVPLKQKDTPGWESQPENFRRIFIYLQVDVAVTDTSLCVILEGQKPHRQKNVV